MPMAEELRREFLTIMGDMYEGYGYPSYCGWIEGLLLVEPKEWSQGNISSRLREIFPAAKYPTSITSVNRALKVLEDYGVVERAGSRKTGYRYRLLSSSSVIATMLERYVVVNQAFIEKMEALSARSSRTDAKLKKALSYEIDIAKLWSRLIVDLLGSIEKNV